jgi:hypothetical protein
MKNKILQISFWLVLLTFLIWDWNIANPVNVFLEPPAITLGSGQKSQGGHCSQSKR